MTDPRPAEILRERHGAVEWVIFNRPHALNAMTYAMEDHLIDIFGTINADASVRAVVITGAAGKKPSFMAGQDFSYLAAVNGIEDLLRLEARGEAVIDALEALRVPTLAAIAGACVGAGALLAAGCDVRIGAPSLRFGFPIARTAANALSLKSLSRIASLLGPAQTKELIFNPRLLGAPALMAACALREIVEDEAALLPRAQAVAEELAALAPLTLWATKQGMTRLRNNALANTKDEDLLIACYNSHDFHEGVAAFLEKRKPVWTGR